MSVWLMILLSSLGLLVLADLMVHLIYAVAALYRFETLPAFQVLPPPQDAPPMESVRIPTTDGLTLAGGVYFPEDGLPKGVVLYCPETGGRFETAMNYTQALVESGFAVVTFGFRNQKPSDALPGYRPNYWVTEYEVDDVHSALDFIAAQPQFQDLPVGLVGVSRGAGAALAAGADRPEVSQVWTQGAFSTKLLALHHAMKFLQAMTGPFGKLIPRWHVKVTIWFMLRFNEYRNRCKLNRLESALPGWQDRDVMFVTGGRDTYVPSYISEQLCRLTGHSLETSHWKVPQARHNQEREASPEKFDLRIVEFFEQMVPQKFILSSTKTAVGR